jgi:nitroreductase
LTLDVALKVPDAPEFGAPVNIASPSPDTLALLARRRSASAPVLTGPAPSPEELKILLRLAARVPDHGKLSPWRFVILEGQAKADYAAALEPLAAEQSSPEKALATLAKLKNPPLTVAVVSRTTECAIPEWEQLLSAGAVCMTMLIAADAMGYAANWITDWYAYEERARTLLGLLPEERVAGFVHLGTSPEPPLERVRPDVEAITSRWARR